MSPVSPSSGVVAEFAVTAAAAALRTPGPGTTENVPTRPVAFA